jgi:hypothetical protein
MLFKYHWTHNEIEVRQNKLRTEKKYQGDEESRKLCNLQKKSDEWQRAGNEGDMKMHATMLAICETVLRTVAAGIYRAHFKVK